MDSKDLYIDWASFFSSSTNVSQHIAVLELFNSIELNPGLKQIPRSTSIMLYNLSRSILHPNIWLCFSQWKRIKRLDNWEMNLSNSPPLLWFPSPSHSVLCVVFSSKQFHYALRCTQITIQDAFYMLQIAFSLLPTAEIVLELSHVHSGNCIKTNM